MKIQITDEVQLDWINHAAEINQNEGTPWLLAPTLGSYGINSSKKSALFLSEPALVEEFLAESALSKAPQVSQCYSVFNGKAFGPWIEVGSNDRLMAGDLGVQIGYGRGIALPCQVKDSALVEILASLDYIGEVTAPVDAEGYPTGFLLGYNPGHLQLYCSLLRKNKVTNVFSFICGEAQAIFFYEEIAANVLVSPEGWPFQFAGAVTSPSEFRQNIFLFPPTALAVASGKTMKELAIRMKKILHVLKQNKEDIQYRIDFRYSTGLRLTFTKYQSLL
jgi:hypothetical protein